MLVLPGVPDLGPRREVPKQFLPLRKNGKIKKAVVFRLDQQSALWWWTYIHVLQLTKKPLQGFARGYLKQAH